MLYTILSTAGTVAKLNNRRKHKCFVTCHNHSITKGGIEKLGLDIFKALETNNKNSLGVGRKGNGLVAYKTMHVRGPSSGKMQAVEAVFRQRDQTGLVKGIKITLH